MAANKRLLDFAERDRSLSRSIAEGTLQEHMCLSHQFAHLLTQPPFRWTFDELREEYRAHVLQRGDTIIVLFDDMSCCEFTKGSIVIQAHAPADIDAVMNRVAAANPKAQFWLQEKAQ